MLLLLLPPPPPKRKRTGTSRLVQFVSSIVKKTYPPNNAPPFIFENTKEATISNSETLKRFNYDMEEVLQSSHNTILNLGTEFRPTKDLEPILSHHIDWTKFESMCNIGVKYSFPKDLEYSKETKEKELLAAIEQGNNKSAQHPDVEKIMDKVDDSFPCLLNHLHKKCEPHSHRLRKSIDHRRIW